MKDDGRTKTAEGGSSNDYVIRVCTDPSEIDASQWNALLAQQPSATPFMRHEYLLALHASGSASAATGWTAQFLAVEEDRKSVV